MPPELLFADIQAEPEEPEPEEEQLDLETGELHMVAVNAKSGKEASRAEATVVSIVVNDVTAPPTVLYAEVVGAEAAVEAVLAGTNPEPSMDVRFLLSGTPVSRGVEKVMFPPECRRVNARLRVPGWGRVIQHAAVAAAGAEFVVVKSESELWPHIRDNVRTPLLSHWGDYLMEHVLEQQVVSPCRAFGIPHGLKCYMLHPNATTLMDRIVSEFVNENVWDLIANHPNRKRNHATHC